MSCIVQVAAVAGSLDLLGHSGHGLSVGDEDARVPVLDQLDAVGAGPGVHEGLHPDQPQPPPAASQVEDVVYRPLEDQAPVVELGEISSTGPGSA